MGVILEKAERHVVHPNETNTQRYFKAVTWLVEIDLSPLEQLVSLRVLRVKDQFLD